MFEQVRGLHMEWQHTTDDEAALAIANKVMPIIPLMLAELDRLTREAEQTCTYKIYVPLENGYNEAGYFYECSCGANYIDAEQAQEWDFCPYCGKKIVDKENYACIDCENAKVDPDFEMHWCSEISDWVSDACADGCQKYKACAESEAAMKEQEEGGKTSE